MAEEEQAENLSGNESEAGELQPIEGEQLADDNAEAGNESEEFEIVLGSAEEPSANEEKPRKPRGIKRLLNERKDNRGRIAELEEQLAAAQQQPQAPPQAAAVPIAPTLESCGFDETALSQANQQYQADSAQYQRAQFSQLLDERENGTQRAREAQREADTLNSHYDRAEKLKIPDFGDAEDALIEILGADAVKQIALVVPNSEMVVNYLGKNSDKAFDLLDTWQNKGSAGALFALGELSKDVKAVRKERKPRPQPESKVIGAAPASKTSLDKEIAAERERVASGEVRDLSHLQSLKRQARSAS